MKKKNIIHTIGNFLFILFALIIGLVVGQRVGSWIYVTTGGSSSDDWGLNQGFVTGSIIGPMVGFFIAYKLVRLRSRK